MSQIPIGTTCELLLLHTNKKFEKHLKTDD